MANDQLIIGTFEECFRKYLYDETVIGKLAHTEFKSGVNRGDEVDVIMPGTVNLFNYDGEGNLPNAEKITTSATKVRIDRGKAFHFFLKEIEKRQIENAPDLKQKVLRVKEYANDAVKQFAAAVDKAYAGLYLRAGYKIDKYDISGSSGDKGLPFIVDAEYCREILSLMRTKFQRGDNEGHNNWIDGQMVAVFPPEFEFQLGKLQMFTNVESGHRKIEKGFIGRLEGWDIMISNNIATTTWTDTTPNPDVNYTVFHPLFGIRNKTLAGGVSKELNTKSYEPDLTFDTAYKGYGLYGVGAPRADYLGTASIIAPAKLSTRS